MPLADKLRDLEERLERTEQLQGWMVAFLQQQLPSITGPGPTGGFLPSRKRRQLLLGGPEGRVEPTNSTNTIQQLISQYHVNQQPQHYGQRYNQYPIDNSNRPQVSMATDVSDSADITTKGAQMSPQMSPDVSTRSSSMSAFVPAIVQAETVVRLNCVMSDASGPDICFRRPCLRNLLSCEQEDSEAVSGAPAPFMEVRTSWGN
eukprot:5624873-Pyramimonas_sp.AAC.3